MTNFDIATSSLSSWTSPLWLYLVQIHTTVGERGSFKYESAFLFVEKKRRASLITHIFLNSILALAEGVPQLDGFIARSGHDLPEDETKDGSQVANRCEHGAYILAFRHSNGTSCQNSAVRRIPMLFIQTHVLAFRHGNGTSCLQRSALASRAIYTERSFATCKFCIYYTRC